MRPEETRGNERGRTAAAGDVVQLVRRYVVQETVGPLRGIVKRLAYGVAGGLLLGVGLLLLLLAVLRVLQTETGTFFAGGYTFAPYLATAALGIVVTGLAGLVMLRAIKKSRRRHR